MLRPLIPTILALFTALISAAQAAEQPKSRFDDLAEPIGKLIKLAITDKGLALDRTAWDTPAAGEQPNPPVVAGAAGVGVRIIGIGGANQTGLDRLFHALTSAAGPGGTSMSMSGINRSYSYSGNGLNIELKTAADRVQIELAEDPDPGNQLSITDDGKGALRIVTMNAAGDCLIFVQTAKGTLHIVHVDDDKPSATRAASFIELYRKDPDFVEQTFFPALTRLGVKAPPSRLSPNVIASVCSRLRPLTDQERADFNALLKKMDDRDQANRDAATDELSKKYFRFAPQIAEAIDKPPSMEVQTRLAKVLSANADQRDIERFVSAMKLTDDPAYLALLAAKVTGADRDAVIARLTQLLKDKLDKLPPDKRKQYMDLINPPPHSLPR